MGTRRESDLGHNNLRCTDHRKGSTVVTPMTNLCHHNCDLLYWVFTVSETSVLSSCPICFIFFLLNLVFDFHIINAWNKKSILSYGESLINTNVQKYKLKGFARFHKFHQEGNNVTTIKFLIILPNYNFPWYMSHLTGQSKKHEYSDNICYYIC